ncbi:MAG: hypothetical protein Fur0021_34660 [Candidatus Promineifilaceae bacterium]
MKSDQDLRLAVLKGYYARRKDDFISASSQNLGSALTKSEILRISEQLYELGLIEFKPLRGDDKVVSAVGRITAKGVDFIEQISIATKPEPVVIEAANRSSLNHITVDVLLVTVTRVEASSVLELLKEKYNREPNVYYISHKTYYDLGSIGGARVFMTRSEMGSGGPSGSATTVLEGIKELSPSAVIMVGIAFGVNYESQNIGDILVSRQILGYELQRIGTGEDNEPIIKLRGDRVLASPRLLDRFRDGELYWDGARVEFGLVLSGEKLVDNLDYRSQLQKLEPEAVGGEMEGAGLYTAAYLQKVDWILVKAICDWADGSKHKDKIQNQRLAARNATSFLIHVIERGGLVDTGQASSQKATKRDTTNAVFPALDVAKGEKGNAVTESVSVDDYSKAEEIIKRHCEQEWGDNYRMRVHCESKQKEAVAKLRRSAPDGIPSEVFTQIRTRCAREWPENYVMRVHCEDKELKAFVELQRETPSDISPEDFERIRAKCAAQWAGNYSMQMHCEDKELDAYRQLQKGSS